MRAQVRPSAKRIRGSPFASRLDPGFAPGNVRALDQLGLAYLSLDQPAEAEKVLREAMAIAPRDPEVLLHLGRALIALDRQPAAQPYLDQFQKLRPQQAGNPRREPGMIELAMMSQEGAYPARDRALAPRCAHASERS
jgi:tetratricopeptide (TPR) repeat protein